MNADPDEGQPTTVPEATTAETVPPEAAEQVTEAEVEAGEADAEVAATEAAEPEAADPEAATEPEAEAGAPETEAAATEAVEPEAEAASEAAAEPAEPEADADEAGEPEAAAAEAASQEPAPATPAPASATTPLVANRYRLVSEIGGGAMGVVWRARDEILGRDVAVKELRPDHGMSGAQVRISHQRARREGRIAARLQHPNAVVIYDVAEHEGRPYLIMEYVPSQSLGDILATGAVLTPAEVARIGAQLASALTAAHEAGIVHRDIKPGNVLMTADGTVKLTDFGISRAAGDATVTATGEILGTPAYTAPEVAQGHPVAFPADVFSLGATLYAAVEGTPPFGEDVNAMATLLRVVRNEIRQPRRSGPLTDTLMWMLTPEPVDRPTMKQVWQGLDALSAKPLPLAGITSRVPETTPFATPSPTLVVPDSVIPESPAPTPEPPAAAQPSAPATPKPKQKPKPKPKPTPAATSTPLPTPIEPASSASGPATESTKPPASTPTSVMGAAPTRNTPVPTSAAAKAASSPTTPQPPAPHSPRRRGRMPLAIAVCAVGTTVLIVAIVVAMNTGKHSSPNQPVAHGSTSTAPSTPGKPTSTSQAPTTPSETPSSSATSSPSSSTSSTPSKPSSPPTSAADPATEIRTFITSYYAMVPNNLTAAWPNMTEAYQTRVARGFDNYKAFWSGYQSVTLSDVVVTLPSTVVATLHYTDKNGNTTTERTSFGLVKEGGVWKINTSNPAG